LGRLNSTIVNGSLNVNGNSYLKRLILKPSENNYQEGIRISKSSSGGWTDILMGLTPTADIQGIETQAWGIYTDPNNVWGVAQGSSDFPAVGLSITNGNTDIRFKNKSLWRDGIAGGTLSSRLFTAAIVGGADVSYSPAYAAGGLEIRSDSASAAFISFHRAGAYALNFGLNKSNALAVGGWSMGAVMKKVWIEGDLITNAVWNDYAELFKKHKPDVTYEPNHIIELEPDTNTYCYSSSANSKKIVGVVSDNYGFLLGGDKDVSNEDNLKNYIPIGLAGRLKVYITGKIEIGDLITSSDIEGVGMKSIENIPGTIVGKSLQNKTTDEIELIEILIMNR
jgi:hypothetical protein